MRTEKCALVFALAPSELAAVQAHCEVLVKRFILLIVIGVPTLLIGEAALGAGLHADSVLSPGALLQGCLALVFGSALFVSGMLGLAEAYEKVVLDFTQLLLAKQLPSAEDLSLRSAAHLQDHNRSFWKAYQKSAMGSCLFLAGLLSLMIGLSRFSLTLYLGGIGAGVVLLGMVAVAMTYRGVRGMHGSCAAVKEAVDLLSSRPDIRPETPAPFVRKRVPSYALFSTPSPYPRRRGSKRRA